MNTNMSTPELIKAVSYASAQSDRWLFLAAFIVLLVLCLMVIRWLVGQLQGTAQEYKGLLNAHQASLENVIKGQGDGQTKLAVVISQNTDVMERCITELNELRRHCERRNPV